MPNRKLLRLKFFARSLLLLGSALFFLSACGALTVFKATPWPGFFKSEDYIIYRIQKQDTPAQLAKRLLGDEKKSWVIEDATPPSAFKKDNFIYIPLKKKNKGGLAANGFQVVPVLCYHRFATNCHSPLCMPVHIFERQVRWLKENGYRVITFRELLEFTRYRQSLPQRAVVITIDDGYRSAYEIAYPTLKKYGFTATLFIYTDFVGASRNAITWEQLRIMKASGFEVGSHSVSHSDLSRPEEGEDRQAYLARIKREVRVSKQILDKKLNQNTIFFAFPYGRYNKRVLEICERSGYMVGASVERGSNPFFADPLALRRNQILKRDMRTFISRLKTFQNVSLK